MDKVEVIYKLNLYSQKINSVFNPEMIYLFGSYAKGNWHEDSDIDVAVIFNKFQENQFDIIKKILKLRRSIDLRIEPVLFEINVDPSGFLKTIMNTGELIYKRSHNEL
jgi:predicted nucleotidyltransferase